MEFKNFNENKERPLSEIAKEVNAMLDPIVEKMFNLKARKEYLSSRDERYSEDMSDILEKADNLGLSKDNIINEELGKELIKAEDKFEENNKILEEIKPDKLLPFDLAKEIKKIDKDGKLEQKLSEVYGFSKEIDGWTSFLVLVSVCLREDPSYWDSFKKESESKK